MYFRNGDPLDDYDRLDRLQAQREARLPVCDKCHRHINDDFYYDVHGDIYCAECMNDEFARSTEDYLNDN